MKLKFSNKNNLKINFNNKVNIITYLLGKKPL